MDTLRALSSHVGYYDRALTMYTHVADQYGVFHMQVAAAIDRLFVQYMRCIAVKAVVKQGLGTKVTQVRLAGSLENYRG